jgi:nitroreductase
MMEPVPESPWPENVPPWELSDLGLLEALATTRTIRRFLPEPIPDGDVGKILWFASRAPSGSNRQPFQFLVLQNGPRASEARTVLEKAFQDRWKTEGPKYGYVEAPASSRAARMDATMNRFVSSISLAPLIVLVGTELAAGEVLSQRSGASVYPAVQNLLLAAHAFGYGGVISMWHGDVEEELHGILGIPDNVHLLATVVLGRPEGHHGPVRRAPLSQLVFADSWGKSPAWAVDPPGTRFSGGAKLPNH